MKWVDLEFEIRGSQSIIMNVILKCKGSQTPLSWSTSGHCNIEWPWRSHRNL